MEPRLVAARPLRGRRGFAACGYHATTTRHIPTAAGVSPAALHVHAHPEEPGAGHADLALRVLTARG